MLRMLYIMVQVRKFVLAYVVDYWKYIFPKKVLWTASIRIYAHFQDFPSPVTVS